MTSPHSLWSAHRCGTDAGHGRRSWQPMTLEYVGHVGDVMKSTHKSGQMGESDVFSNHKA